MIRNAVAQVRKKILAISGSTRSNSTSESILKIITNLFLESLDVEIYDGIAHLPHFNPDLDNEDAPESVKRFREMIEKADGIVICTPEYVFSLPGALKNALEWTVSTTVFSNKPTALIVASSLGEKAYESLILILNTLGAKIGENAKLLIQGARNKFNGEMNDETVLKDIVALINSLKEIID